MMNYINSNKLTLANNLYAKGIETCIKKKDDKQIGGSVIDLVLTDSNLNIDKLIVDSHPIFSDHRPVIFSLNSSKCKVIACNKHFVFRSIKPNVELLITFSVFLNTKFSEYICFLYMDGSSHIFSLYIEGSPHIFLLYIDRTYFFLFMALSKKR